MFNRSVINAAQRVADAARQDFFAIRAEGAVTLAAVAGAGKSYFVTETAMQCLERRMRVAVAAPTNEQVFSLVAAIADRNPARQITFLPAQHVSLPSWAQRRNVVSVTPAHHANGHDLIVGTIDKLAGACNPRRHEVPALRQRDALIMDESYQANSGKYYGVAGIAPRHLCVGDSGQILPFSNTEAGYQWKGLLEDPLKTAIGVLHAYHPETPAYRFPVTRRLDSRAVRVARAFYRANHVFDAALMDGVREMHLASAQARTSRLRAIDRCLDFASREGWGYFELSGGYALPADPETAELIVNTITRLLSRSPQLVCERHRQRRALEQEQIAVVVSFKDQRGLLMSALAHAGLGRVTVETANKLQGLEFEVVLCWHPLAGLDSADSFHLEAGRMCVMCTRHRHACIVFGRAGDRELVQSPAPATPAWPDHEDEILRGWEVHQQVFEQLTPYLVPIH